MQVKELAVGDWVQNPLGYKAVILDIRRYDDGRDAFRYVVKIGEDSNNEQRLAVEELLPIPLTPEILEKNGFKIDYYSRMLPYLLDGFPFVITGNESKNKLYGGTYVYGSEEDYIDKQFECCYVHELQHALRLCGIDKEIEL